MLLTPDPDKDPLSLTAPLFHLASAWGFCVHRAKPAVARTRYQIRCSPPHPWGCLMPWPALSTDPGRSVPLEPPHPTVPPPTPCSPTAQAGFRACESSFPCDNDIFAALTTWPWFSSAAVSTDVSPPEQRPRGLFAQRGLCVQIGFSDCSGGVPRFGSNLT